MHIFTLLIEFFVKCPTISINHFKPFKEVTVVVFVLFRIDDQHHKAIANSVSALRRQVR